MFSALCVLAPSLALASPVQAQPVAVTVYPDRAWVEREVVVELAAGAQTVVIDNLPANVDPDTIQAMASGPAAVTDVQYKTRAIATPPHTREPPPAGRPRCSGSTSTGRRPWRS